MNPDANEILLYLLEQIKSDADLIPEKTEARKKASAILMKECMEGSEYIVENSKIIAQRCFKFSKDKEVYLSENQIKEYKGKFGSEIENILGVFKDKEILLDFQPFYDKDNGNRYGLLLPKNFDALYKKYKAVYSSDNKIIKREKQGHLIERDSQTGDFYYKNKIINFENKDSIYYLIFECLFENGDLEGFCSYEIVNTYLEKHGHKKYKDKQQISDRIKNGLESLFRFSNLKPDTPNGKELIKKVRGKGLILYNP